MWKTAPLTRAPHRTIGRGWGKNGGPERYRKKERRGFHRQGELQFKTPTGVVTKDAKGGERVHQEKAGGETIRPKNRKKHFKRRGGEKEAVENRRKKTGQLAAEIKTREKNWWGEEHGGKFQHLV